MNNRTNNILLDSFSRMFDCLLLGLLWMVCSLPVVTMGAAGTAVYYAYNKSVRQDQGHPCKAFFHSFRADFKQATLVWLVVLAVLLVLFGDLFIVLGASEPVPMGGLMLTFAVTMLAVVLTWCAYLFPYISRFSLDTKNVMKNCLFIMGIEFGWSVLLFLVTLLAIAAFVVAFFMGFMVVAVYVPIANRILERIFRKYMEPEDLREQWELSKTEA